ncbi:MAG TPA: nucleotide exchange factor GrpE, partial [Myxococcota bacterium]|nr:nucleotide exchange factor GrpE [Myxococcota bacterium]
QMIEVLQRFGVEFYASVGQRFDPARHEAVAEKEDADVEPGIIITEYQKGCMLHGRLLRPARVLVAKKAG